MKKEYLEPWKQIYPTKNELAKAWSNWFDSKSDEWELFTMTVVFKSGGKIPRPDRWEGAYKKYVLNKIKRALEPNQKNQEHTIPYEEFFYYEKDDSSLFRISRSHKPHHIHSLIPIKKSQVHRFWSIDSDDLLERIKKDIYSVKTIQSVFVEKVKADKTIDWIKYTLKGKTI
jgi:hypothetical protein